MNDFEQQLTRALRRVDAPETLAQFLMAAAEVEAERHLPRRERKHRWAWVLPQPRVWAMGALAAVVVAGGLAGEQVHRRQVRQAEATEQFNTAMRITDQALDKTREQLLRSGIRLND